MLCRECLDVATFPNNQVARAAGWDVPPDNSYHYCPSCAIQHDYIYVVLFAHEVIKYGVIEVNNKDQALRVLSERHPTSVKVTAFRHEGEEQEETA